METMEILQDIQSLRRVECSEVRDTVGQTPRMYIEDWISLLRFGRCDCKYPSAAPKLPAEISKYLVKLSKGDGIRTKIHLAQVMTWVSGCTKAGKRPCPLEALCRSRWWKVQNSLFIATSPPGEQRLFRRPVGCGACRETEKSKQTSQDRQSRPRSGKKRGRK